MRDYSKVSGAFWTGMTGKALRGDQSAQIVCLYLMTSPHANLIGVYHCPILYIAHETGLTVQGASKGLARAIEGGFCTYDHPSEVVFVHAFARYQLLDGAGEALKAGDKRVSAVIKAVSNITNPSIRAAFVAEYASTIPGLIDAPSKGLARAFDAPPKPEAGTEAETGTEKSPPTPQGGMGEKGEEKPKPKPLPEVTVDAVSAFNASKLVKANGGLLPSENLAIGQTLCQKNINRCIEIARAIAAEMGTSLDAEWWAGYFDACHADDFWSGRKGGSGGYSNWTPDFASLTRPDIMRKIYQCASAGVA